MEPRTGRTVNGHWLPLFLLLVALIGGRGVVQAQSDTTSSEPQGIIYVTGEEADSLMPGYVYRFRPLFREVKLRSLYHPDLDPSGVQQHNATHRLDGDHYADLGALGQVQTSIAPLWHPFGISGSPFSVLRSPFTTTLTPDVHPAYSRLHDENMFQTLKPYTLLGYGSSLNKDYQISIVHTQNIQPRWNVAFLYDLVSRDGLYTNSEVTNHVMDATTNYYSKDARYQLQGSLTFNRMRQQENGGVADDTSCWNYPRESGVPVNMYAAQNQWRRLELNIHQSFNTVRQFFSLRPKIEHVGDSVSRDTIVGYDTIYPHKPHVFNSGVFALDLNFARHRRIFYDWQATSWFYDNAVLDTTLFLDSTRHYTLSAELYWTNDAYMSHRWQNPLVVTAGVRPEYNSIRYTSHIAPNTSNFFYLTPFARAVITLPHSLSLSLSTEEVTGGYRNGDYRLQGQMAYGNLIVSATSEALSPDYLYYRGGGVYHWTRDDYRKTKHQQIAAAYSFVQSDTVKGFLRHFQVRGAATLISDNVWIDATMNPIQGDATALLTQAMVNTHLRFGWFNMRMQHFVQHTTDPDVVRVPIFATKSSLYADLYIFRRALRLQSGVDLRYHTRFKADGWNPVLGAFYRQDNVEVGNYLVADFWVNLQVKRASIYLKAGHFNAPLESLIGLTPNYFSLPHYPMEGFSLYWGVIWKFFN